MASVGLRQSRIEVFRTRNHGNQIFRLYKLNVDGETLSTIFTLHKGWCVASNTDTTEGAADFFLTIDAQYSQGLTEEDLNKAAFGDMINPDTGKYRRYRLVSDGRPLVDDERFMFGLHGAYNDKKEIVDGN